MADIIARGMAANAKIDASVFKYRGTVSTYNDLPTSNVEVGDVYNIATADPTHHINAGDNVAWDGTDWDKLGGDVDLSNYLAKDNTTAFTPSGDYNPATKKYVDDNSTSFKSFPSSFVTDGTTQQFLSSVENAHLPVGMAYLGQVSLSDMPDGVDIQAEVEVYVYPQNVIYCIMRSAEVSPYEWECNSYEYRGWEAIDKTAKDYADANFLKKNNTTAFTPTGDYNPSTKKYVDDGLVGKLTYKGHVNDVSDLPSIGQPSATIVTPNVVKRNDDIMASGNAADAVKVKNFIDAGTNKVYNYFIGQLYTSSQLYYGVATDFPEMIDYVAFAQVSGYSDYKVFVHLNYDAQKPVYVRIYGSSARVTPDDGTNDSHSHYSNFTLLTKSGWMELSYYSSGLYGNIPHLKFKRYPLSYYQNNSSHISLATRYASFTNSSSYTYVDEYQMFGFSNDNVAYYISATPSPDAKENNMYTVGTNNDIYVCNAQPAWELWSAADLANYYTKTEIDKYPKYPKILLTNQGYSFENPSVTSWTDTETADLNKASEIITYGYTNGLDGIFVGKTNNGIWSNDKVPYYKLDSINNNLSQKPTSIYFSGIMFPYLNSTGDYYRYISGSIAFNGTWSDDTFTCTSIVYSNNTTQSGKGLITTWNNDNAKYPEYDSYNPATAKYVDKVANNLAPVYSSSSTYNIGDYVVYENKLYKCNTTISTAENWTSAHWTFVNVSEIINAKQDIIQYSTMPAVTVNDLGKVAQYVGTTDSTYTNGYFYKVIQTTQSSETVYKWSRINVQPTQTSPIMMVTITKSGNTYTPSASTTQILTAITNNQEVNIYLIDSSTQIINPLNIVAASVAANAVFAYYDDGTTYTMFMMQNTTITTTTSPRNLANYLAKNNTSSFTPSGDYNPATKKYVDDVAANLASTYDSSAKYAVGDYVIYQNVLYECTTAITTAEDWDATHWSAIKVVEMYNDLPLFNGSLYGKKKGLYRVFNGSNNSFGLSYGNGTTGSWSVYTADGLIYITKDIDGTESDGDILAYFQSLTNQDNPRISFKIVKRDSSLQPGCSVTTTLYDIGLVSTNKASIVSALVKFDMLPEYNNVNANPTNDKQLTSKKYVDTTANNVLSNIAPAYDATQTYDVGDYVIYNGSLYVCNTDITVAEAWTAAHWTQTTIVEILGNIQTALGGI